MRDALIKGVHCLSVKVEPLTKHRTATSCDALCCFPAFEYCKLVELKLKLIMKNTETVEIDYVACNEFVTKARWLAAPRPNATHHFPTRLVLA